MGNDAYSKLLKYKKKKREKGNVKEDEAMKVLHTWPCLVSCEYIKKKWSKLSSITSFSYRLQTTDYRVQTTLYKIIVSKFQAQISSY